MNRCFQAALAAAGLVAFAGQAGAADVRLPPSLTAFGAAGNISPSSATALSDAALRGPASRISQDILAGDPVTLRTSFGSATMPHEFRRQRRAQRPACGGYGL